MSGDLVGSIRREIEYMLYRRYAEALGRSNFFVLPLPEHLCPPSEVERVTVPISSTEPIRAGDDQEMDFVLEPVLSVFIVRELWSGGGLWAWVWHGRADWGDVYYALRPAPAYGGEQP